MGDKDKWKHRTDLGIEVGFLKNSTFILIQQHLAEPFLTDEERTKLVSISEKPTAPMGDKEVFEFLENASNYVSDIAKKYRIRLTPNSKKS